MIKGKEDIISEKSVDSESVLCYNKTRVKRQIMFPIYIYPPVAKLDIAADSDSEGRGFESSGRAVIGGQKRCHPIFSVFMRVCGLLEVKSEKRFYRRCPNSKPQQNPSQRGFHLIFQAGGPAFLRFTPFSPLSEL